MSTSRRQFLMFFAGSAGAAIFAPEVGEKIFGSSVAEAQTVPLSFTPVRLPNDFPIYQRQKAYLATGINQGTVLSAGSNKLPSYTALDDVIVPPEYERYVIVGWGDKVFPNPEEYFGFNCDYTGFVPIGRSNDDGYLFVNHEYTSYPFSANTNTAIAQAGFQAADIRVLGRNLSTAPSREYLGESMYNMGGSILRISRRNSNRRFSVVTDARNRRIHGLSGLGINSSRPAPYNAVTSWGTRSYQQGDQNYLEGTGPAATEVFINVNTDGLGNRIIGTAYNCSGATTPWGTILTAEENFQGTVQEAVRPNGTQTGYQAGVGTEFGLVGEKYGWMVEIDLANPNFRPKKHTWLGRFRHENAAFRIEAGKRLVAYMGDDRRGGHTWKFVSTGTVTSPTNKANSSLFERGILYVAQFNPDNTGRWIPLVLDTPTNPIAPSTLQSQVPAAVISAVSPRPAGTIAPAILRLPNRLAANPLTGPGGSTVVTAPAAIPALYQGKTLRNFYTSQGAILCDAFLAANLVGGTPTARPEDLEYNPRTKEVFIAYTDGAPSSDGYPDSRIFVVAKYTSAVNAVQQSGGIYKIIEDSADGTGLTFRWQKLAQGGEIGAGGNGFANIDNLLVDDRGHVWGVTDMSTGFINGFNEGVAGTPIAVNHTVTGDSTPLIGVLGNNSLLFVPVTGPDAGQVIPFAYGPTRCELTGPTFVGDTLIVAVQHPGEDCPINDGTMLNRSIEMLDSSGGLYNQTRMAPRGSSWPSNMPVADGGLNQPTGAPRPVVIGIRRKNSSGRFI